MDDTLLTSNPCRKFRPSYSQYGCHMQRQRFFAIPCCLEAILKTPDFLCRMLARYLNKRIAARWRKSFPFFALPSEIRNEIYEWSLTPDGPMRSHPPYIDVDILDAMTLRPWTEILLSCRQTNSEARVFCAEARDRYWQDTNFAIYCQSKAEDGITTLCLEPVYAVNEVLLSKIQHLTIRGPSVRCGPATLQLEKGVWRRTSRVGNTQTMTSHYMVLISKAYMETVRDTVFLPFNCPKRYEKVKGMQMYCWLRSTGKNDSPHADEDGKFHVLCAYPSEANRHMLQVINEEVGQEALTRKQLIGLLCMHVWMGEAQ